MEEPDPWGLAEIPELRGPRVTLRKLRPADIDERRALGHVAEESRMYGGDLKADAPMSQEAAERWYQDGAGEPGRYRWAIVVDGRLIGSCGLRPAGGRLRFAIGISDPLLWGQGLGTETARLVVAFAFDRLQANVVELMVLEFNKRAIRSYEKAGFRLREILPDNFVRDGEAFDDWLMEVRRRDPDE